MLLSISFGPSHSLPSHASHWALDLTVSLQSVQCSMMLDTEKANSEVKHVKNIVDPRKKNCDLEFNPSIQ